MNDQPAPDRSSYFDLAQVLRVLRERKWVIIAPVIIALAASLALSMRAVPQFRATAEVLRQSTSLDEALFGAQIFQVLDEQRALETAAGLVVQDGVAERVKTDLSSSQSVASLREMITVAPQPAADILMISAVSSIPSKAASVANAFARQFILYRQASDRATLRAAADKVQAQLDAMTPVDRASARGLTLSQKVEELAVLESMQTGGFELVAKAAVPTSPFSPRTVRNAGVALALGLIVGLVIAFLVHLFDRRMKDEDTVEREFGATVISSIPSRGYWLGRRRRRSALPIGFADPGSPTLEAFRALRSNLEFFRVGRQIKSIVVTSPLPREGKTTTAINLALTLAMSGSRVILLEADLRRPMIQEYLQLAGNAGFSDLLAGTESIAQVAQRVDLNNFLSPDQVSRGLGTNGNPIAQEGLLCIASGPTPPNPAELLAMDKTSEILGQMGALCDFLVIDAPPILLVSDALELAKKADGVILVARLLSTKIEEGRRAREILRQIGVAPLGVVAIGARKSQAYFRRYQGYYAR